MSSSASSQIFLYLEMQGRAIKGEASAAAYEDEIEIESFSFDLGKESDESKAKKAKEREDKRLAALREGKPPPEPPEDTAENTLTLSKFYDKASVNLSRYLANGARFDEARLTVDHHAAFAGSKEANPAMTVHLFNGRITNIQLSLSDSDKSAKLTEQVKLSYRKIEVVYYESKNKDRASRSASHVFSYELTNYEA